MFCRAGSGLAVESLVRLNSPVLLKQKDPLVRAGLWQIENVLSPGSRSPQIIGLHPDPRDWPYPPPSATQSRLNAPNALIRRITSSCRK
jgi:hypothetical protein